MRLFEVGGLTEEEEDSGSAQQEDVGLAASSDGCKSAKQASRLPGCMPQHSLPALAACHRLTSSLVLAATHISTEVPLATRSAATAFSA